MTDTYPSYTALAAAETEGVAYERRSVAVTGAKWCAIAIHGGGIEPGSGEMARYVGAGLMNHYEFAGILSADNGRLHVTSTNFDEPTAQGIVTAAKRCLSFHGYTGTTGVAETSIGGLDTATAGRVADALTRAGFRVITAVQEINGNDAANITNKTTISAGVQLEMSSALRASFFPNGDLTRTMRDSGQRTPAFYAYAAAVLSAYDGQGMVSQGSVNVSRWTTVPWSSADADLTASMATDALATGGSHFLHLVARLADTNNNYLARLAFNTDQTLTLTLRKRVTGTETLLATAPATTTLTHAAGRRFSLRFQITGSTLSAKVWPTGAAEPPQWHVSSTDASLTAAGAIGTRSILSSTNTNTLPVVASYDSFQQITPQTMTVVRSVNGIAKAQAAGTDVRLAQPATAAL